MNELPGAEAVTLEQGAAWAQLAGRCQIELTGADRTAFFNGLATNRVKDLAPGSGCETFLCNAQGKTIGHGYLFCTTDSLVFDTSPGQAATLMVHIDRYLIREQVVLTDRTNDWAELILAGAKAPSVLQSLGAGSLPIERLDHRLASLAPRGGSAALDVSVRRVDYVRGECFFLSVAASAVQELIAALESAGATRVSLESIEAARIEAGTPVFGVEITPEHLPQELARDEKAISFVKGCYLGQETVARLDALGHVNRLLVQVRFRGPVLPAPDSPLHLDGKPIGKVTSAAWSARHQAYLALAYVRRAQAKSGQALDECDVL